MKSYFYRKPLRRKRAAGMVAKIFCAWFSLCWPTLAISDPWAMAGDLGLRSDIQLLADEGVISAPVMAWPIPWGAIADGIATWRSDSSRPASPAVLAAVRRLDQRMDLLYRTRGLQPSARVEVLDSDYNLRSFEASARDNGSELEFGLSSTFRRTAFGLRVQRVSDPADNQEWRLDGSYGAVVVGNHVFSAGAVDRWWGPGWQGSLVYSNNARPIPALAVERNVALPFENRWVSWLGPWSYKLVYGQFENHRDVPNARFFGFHISARPIRDLEIAISRTAQWCGQGRPCGFSTFADLLVGNDNRGDAGITLENEPGNQLASIDFRWRSPVGDLPYAVYGQAAAEDEAGGLPSRWVALVGFELWHRVEQERVPGTWRSYLEFVETASEFYSDTRFNYTYEHFIYSDGYRYKGRAIGHGLDADSQSIGAGFVFALDSGNQWSGLFRWGILNREGDGRAVDLKHSVVAEEQKFIEARAAYSFSVNTERLRLGRITLGGGTLLFDDQVSRRSDRDLWAMARWSWDFRSP